MRVLLSMRSLGLFLRDDLESAAAAGCKSVLIKNSKNQYLIPNARYIASVTSVMARDLYAHLLAWYYMYTVCSYHVDGLDELIPLFDSLIARPAALADGLRK